MSDGVPMQESVTVTTGTDAATEMPAWICRCGATERHPSTPNMCMNGHFVSGNQARRLHGVRAFETTGRLPEVLRQTVEEFREAVIADRGGHSELSTLERLDPGTTKNGEGRSFPFTADIEKVLKEQLAIHTALKKSGRVIPCVFHRDGERIRYFRAAWENACTEAGCPNALVHDMRRSAVQTFERAGVPRSAAMSMVGHKTESIYRRYAIVDEAMQREAAARLDAWSAAPQASQKTGTVKTFKPKTATVTKQRRQRSA